jgi:hypothetical protein
MEALTSRMTSTGANMIATIDPRTGEKIWLNTLTGECKPRR